MNQSLIDKKSILDEKCETKLEIEDSVAARTKEIAKRPKRERSPPIQLSQPAPKSKKPKEIVPKQQDKAKWTMEEQKQFFSALRIYGKNFEALGRCFNARRSLVNPDAQKRTNGQIRCFYYRSFRTVSKLCTLTDGFDKKPTIMVLHQLIRNGNAFLRVKGHREHVSIIGKALKPPKASTAISSTKQSDRPLPNHVKVLLSPANSFAYMRVGLAMRHPHVEMTLSQTTTIFELSDKLTQYWQLNTQAASLFKASCSQSNINDEQHNEYIEQIILYPHRIYSSSVCQDTAVSALVSTTDDLIKKTINEQLNARCRSTSDSEKSCSSTTKSLPTADNNNCVDISSITTPTLTTRKRNNLSESEMISDLPLQKKLSPPPPVSSLLSLPSGLNKSSLARTAMIMAAKKAAYNQETTNEHGFMLSNLDITEDEADSSGNSNLLFKHRYDIINLNEEVCSEDEVDTDMIAVHNEMEIDIPLASKQIEITVNNDVNNIQITPAPMIPTTPKITMADLRNGISRTNNFLSSLTIGQIHKMFQRPKELRFVYDFTRRNNIANKDEDDLTFLHYIIQLANQCLVNLTVQKETKTMTKKSTKKQRTKCLCSCCNHHGKDNNRRITPTTTKIVSNSNEKNLIKNDVNILLQTPKQLPNDYESNVQYPHEQIQQNSNITINVQSMDDLDNVLIPEQNLLSPFSWPTTYLSTFEQQQQTTINSLLTTSVSASNPLSNSNHSGITTTVTTSNSNNIRLNSTNSVIQPIDDPLIQSLAAEQAATAAKRMMNDSTFLSGHKRVRKPLRYGDQAIRASNMQTLLSDAVQNALAANNLVSAKTQSMQQKQDNKSFLTTIKNDRRKMSNVDFEFDQTTIVNAALQSKDSRLRLDCDWPDEMSDLSLGSFRDVLEHNSTLQSPEDIDFHSMITNDDKYVNDWLIKKYHDDFVSKSNDQVGLLNIHYIIADCGGEFKVLCYFSSWTGIHPEPKVCTHIIYTFARIEEDNTLTGVWSNPLKEFKLNKDPDVKILLAIGGQDYAIKRADEMMSKNESRSKFVISTTKLLRTHEFDGIDLNFEPSEALGLSQTPNPPLIEDKNKLTNLCRELQEEYAAEAERTGRQRLLITVTTSGIKKHLESRYDVEELSKCADWLNIQGFDYRGSQDKIAEHPSSLYSATTHSGADLDLNQAASIRYLVSSNNVQPSKLLLGLPVFGKKFRLTSDLHDIGSPANCLQSASYTELCRNLVSGWQHVWLDDRKVPIMIKGDEVIGYDDPKSIALKVNYAKDQGLSGVFLYPVNFDDSSGQSCNQGHFPLVQAAKTAVANYTVPCIAPTEPPLNTTAQPRNRTKLITPKWKSSRSDYLTNHNKYHRKSNSSSSPLKTSVLVVLNLCTFYLMIISLY
ncbi:unnamed protein product [Didymodactylos carnosus]|uniref:GH18 domain-containing protein n=1 Tax=Didymodactylos carnosus TaxID=1234261 RepID=A0A814DLI1_9BILA|nr:unnamed protein product [Didymodactylos carnosus]CAF0955723.1 unnamed protein product [Didymodactylos carnosus]CAF3591207.1 unnamed protein product [Didymodactylos carnosus]CAF3730788.1 unnamed protein product [Didymodactylos carnosus]